MIQLLYPYEYMDSVFAIDYEKLYALGYRGIIFDIDNTLVHHGDDSTPEVDELFRQIHALGFKTLLLSNNSEERILSFIKNIDTLYIEMADKPDTKGFKKAIQMLDLPKDQIVCVGDQVFTDIFGANRCKLPNILVKYIGYGIETKIGIRRHVEEVILWTYKKLPWFTHRIGDIKRDDGFGRVPGKKKKLFCEISPLTYKISFQKEVLKRHIKNILSKETFAHTRKAERLPVVVSKHKGALLKRGPGIDPVLQENKADNIRLACSKMNGLIIHPGETYSFWKLVGNTTTRSGYKAGRAIVNNEMISSVGGGLCNLANTIHLLILESPMTVTELHHHSDALAPDPNGVRIPYSAGTSVGYNYVDFRFRNDTDQDVQLRLWCDDDTLYGQLRSERPYPYRYELLEEGHHFHQEGDKFYRISKIYRRTVDKVTGEEIGRELNWDNHSEVMFDYDLIPKDQIR